MELGRNWKIESDSLNIKLFKKSQKSGAKKLWIEMGFYSSVKNALHGLVEHGVKETELKDIKTINDKIEELHTLIENLEEVKM